MEEVSPRRSEPGQISEPPPQSQVGKTVTPPPALQDKQVIQRQVQRPPVPEEKPKPAVQKSEETEQPQKHPKTIQSSKPSIDPESGGPEKILKASEDLTLKRPAVQKPKEEIKTVEVQREPLRETAAPKKPVQVTPPAEDKLPKIEKSGKMETGEKQARSTSPDKTPVPLPGPETPKTIKKPEVRDKKPSGDEPVRIQPLKKMGLLRQQKRRAEAAVQRMLEKSPDKSRPFTQPAGKTEMPLAQRQEIKRKEQVLGQEKPAKPVLTVSAGRPHQSSEPLSKRLFERPMRLNLWKQADAKVENSRSYHAAEPLRRIEKTQKGVLKPSLQQKITRRSLVQRTLAIRKPAVQPLTLRKSDEIHPDKGPVARAASDKKTGLLSPVTRPVVQKPINKPAASGQASSQEPKNEKFISGKTTLRKSTLLQRTILQPERKVKPPSQKTSVQKVDLRPQTGKSLPPEMPLRKSAQTINQRKKTGRTEKPFSESVSRARVPVFRPGLQPKTTVQRLLAHQKRTTSASSNLFLEQKQPQRRMVSEEKERAAVQREEPRKLEKSAPARSGSVVQRMLETALPKPLRLSLNQKAGRKTDSQSPCSTVSNHILAAGLGTDRLVQRIQSRNVSTAQHIKKEAVQPQAQTAEFLRKKIEQAFPPEPELPVVNIARQSGSGNLVQREIENKQAAAEELSPSMGDEGPQPGEPQQDPASAPQFEQVEDVSWSMQADAGPEQAEKPDLQSLARQVFPIVKRLLALEKERSTGKSF